MAGTLNTSNYSFKKYAPTDTVSMLQTFNGNMDLIDIAIKDRQDAIDVNTAGLTKLENSVSSINDGLNSTNKTLSALQVSVTTNKQNIDLLETDTANLNTRVEALETGGDKIDIVQTYQATAYNKSFIKLYKQGKHYWGFGFVDKRNAYTTSDRIVVSQIEDYPTDTISVCKAFSIQGNPLNLTKDVARNVGNANQFFKKDTSGSGIANTLAMYDGTNTYFGFYIELEWVSSSCAFSIDSVLS